MIVKNDFDLSEILWYRIGGKAKYFLGCKNKEDILEALDFVKKNNITKIFVCGLGSNLIFTDEYYDGAVICIAKDPAREQITIDAYGNIDVFAGEFLDSLITFSFENNLTGLEWAGGLPGTVGAGVRGNVGAYGGEIKDSLLSVEVLDYSGETPEIKTIQNADLQFVYRGSLIKTNKKMIVISAKFGLKKTTDYIVVEARKIYAKNIQTRKDRHPLEYPNCGSVFKNLRKPEEIEKVLSIYPELKEDVEKKWYGKIAAASLIEKLGLKGYRVGNAQVSEKHALFIVNLGQAKAKDVLQIIEDIQRKFQEVFGFTLEIEVEIVK